VKISESVEGGDMNAPNIPKILNTVGNEQAVNRLKAEKEKTMKFGDGCPECHCSEGRMRMNDIVAATIHKGEPRYVLAVMNRDSFDYFKNRGWEVMYGWTGDQGTLLVPPDEEEEHDARRRMLGKATLAEMRDRKGNLGFLAALMRKIDQAN
jgi:hypothetical protein